MEQSYNIQSIINNIADEEFNEHQKTINILEGIDSIIFDSTHNIIYEEISKEEIYQMHELLEIEIEKQKNIKKQLNEKFDEIKDSIHNSCDDHNFIEVYDRDNEYNNGCMKYGCTKCGFCKRSLY